MISFLAVGELATYGVAAAYVSFIGPFLGLEFSSYAHRLMLGDDESRWSFYLANAMVFQMGSSLIMVLLLIVLWYLNLVSSPLAPLLMIGLIFLDNLAHELSKLHATLKKPMQVAVLSFWRYGVWVIPLLFVLYFSPKMRSAEVVIVFWACGSFLASLYGFWVIDRKLMREISFKLLDLRWILEGVKVCIIYLMVASLMRIFSTFDRIALEFFSTELMVASYVAFYSIGGAWRALLDSGIMVKRTPELIELVRKGRNQAALGKASETIFLLLKSYPIGLVVIAPVAYLFFLLAGKEEYLSQFYLLPLVFLMQLAAHVAGVYHAILYGQERDQVMLFIHLGMVMLFFSGVVLLAPVFGAVGLLVFLSTVYLAMGYIKRRFFCAEI